MTSNRPANSSRSAKIIAFPKQKTYACADPFEQVFRFKITLQDVKPVVSRKLEVPDSYTFWDFHVAITDAFAWLDYHLHEFTIPDPKTGKPRRLGSPDEEGFGGVGDVPPVESDKDRKLSDLFGEKNTRATYLYDFGDEWEHAVKLEAIQPRETGVNYPRCIAGSRACPPDDCGGAYGYAELLRTIRKPHYKDHAAAVGWLRRMKGEDFDPDFFDPDAVHFDDPGKRWAIAVLGGKMTPDMRCWDFFQKSQKGLV